MGRFVFISTSKTPRFALETVYNYVLALSWYNQPMQQFKGAVQRGLGRGSALGFPTINLPLNGENISGVYAAQVHVKDGVHPAVVFADPERSLIEAHLLDFDRDLYGTAVTIDVREKIRDRKAFPSDAELKIAIEADIAKVKECFKN